MLISRSMAVIFPASPLLPAFRGHSTNNRCCVARKQVLRHRQANGHNRWSCCGQNNRKKSNNTSFLLQAPPCDSCTQSVGSDAAASISSTSTGKASVTTSRTTNSTASDASSYTTVDSEGNRKRICAKKAQEKKIKKNRHSSQCADESVRRLNFFMAFAGKGCYCYIS